MSKINMTYGSGFYIRPDMDYRALDDRRALDRKRKRDGLKKQERQSAFASRRQKTESTKKKSLLASARREGGGVMSRTSARPHENENDEEEEGEEDEEEEEEGTNETASKEDLPYAPGSTAIRQTFSIPFDMYCGHCKKRLGRGVHVYTNRRPTAKKYLGAIRVWSLEIRCRFCHGRFFLETDPDTPKETGGYKCAKDCYREGDDFAVLNAKNKEVQEAWALEAKEKAQTPMEAMERENRAARELAVKQKEIETLVSARATGEEEGMEEQLLSALRRVGEEKKNAESGGGGREGETIGRQMPRDTAAMRAAVPSSSSSPHGRGEAGPTATSAVRHISQLLRAFGGGRGMTHEKGEGENDGKMKKEAGEEEEEEANDVEESYPVRAEDAEAEERAYQQFEAEMLLAAYRERQTAGTSSAPLSHGRHGNSGGALDEWGGRGDGENDTMRDTLTHPSSSGGGDALRRKRADDHPPTEAEEEADEYASPGAYFAVSSAADKHMIARANRAYALHQQQPPLLPLYSSSSSSSLSTFLPAGAAASPPAAPPPLLSPPATAASPSRASWANVEAPSLSWRERVGKEPVERSGGAMRDTRRWANTFLSLEEEEDDET